MQKYTIYVLSRYSHISGTSVTVSQIYKLPQRLVQSLLACLTARHCLKMLAVTFRFIYTWTYKCPHKLLSMSWFSLFHFIPLIHSQASLNVRRKCESMLWPKRLFVLVYFQHFSAPVCFLFRTFLVFLCRSQLYDSLQIYKALTANVGADNSTDFFNYHHLVNQPAFRAAFILSFYLLKLLLLFFRFVLLFFVCLFRIL